MLKIMEGTEEGTEGTEEEIEEEIEETEGTTMEDIFLKGKFNRWILYYT